MTAVRHTVEAQPCGPAHPFAGAPERPPGFRAFVCDFVCDFVRRRSSAPPGLLCPCAAARGRRCSGGVEGPPTTLAWCAASRRALHSALHLSVPWLLSTAKQRRLARQTGPDLGTAPCCSHVARPPSWLRLFSAADRPSPLPNPQPLTPTLAPQAAAWSLSNLLQLLLGPSMAGTGGRPGGGSPPAFRGRTTAFSLVAAHCAASLAQHARRCAKPCRKQIISNFLWSLVAAAGLRAGRALAPPPESLWGPSGEVRLRALK
jgi:hypothetical protein